MKRFFIILLTVCLLLFPASCGKQENPTESIADEVVINIPKDNSVNGYRTESNQSTDGMPDKIDVNDVNVGDIESQTNSAAKDYCANKNSKVFHKSDCGSVSSMSESNKYFADRDTLISEGYKPCGKCNP